MDVGEAMFARAPFDSVHISDVAEAADVSIGTVYTHFGNKDGLFLAVADRAMLYAADYVRERGTGKTPAERIENIAEAYLEAMLERSFLVRLLVSDFALPADAAVLARMTEHLSVLYVSLAGLIDEGIAAGFFRPVGSGLLARYLVGSWNGVIAMSMHSAASTVNVDQLAECLQSAGGLILAGLTAPSPAEGAIGRHGTAAG
ncbi:TetR/AcrR family transcriptional regulator [Mycolicibacterium diernhoferi]|nr:TetR/AcrR family transcriptional regulator [Mycolicibacterium diernhoferi]QYL22416.1 TetR/AcrR family transcriptional regulator [Mycolicibacterium diernhoferi]